MVETSEGAQPLAFLGLGLDQKRLRLNRTILHFKSGTKMDKKTADILDKWLLAAERLGASYEFYRVAKALEVTLKAENMGMNTSQFIANVFKAAEQPHLDKRVQAKILSFIDTLPKEWRAKVPDEVVLRHIPAGKWDDFRPKNWVEENKLAAASLETAPEAEPKTNAWDQMVVSGSAGHQAFEFHYAAAPEKKFIGGYSSRRGEFYLLSGAKVLGCWASQPEYEQALAALPYEEIPAGAKPDRVISKIAVTFGKKICIGIRSGDGKLVFPGGHVEPGETPLEAAVRELAEETGIQAQDYELSHLGTKLVVSPRGYLMEVHAYSLGVDSEVHTTVADDPDGEVLKWLWVDYSAGLPKEVLDNLYVPLEKDYLLQALGLAPEVLPEASVLSVLNPTKVESSGSMKFPLGTKVDATHMPGSLGKGVIVKHYSWGRYGVQFEGAAFVMELSPHDIERMVPKEEKATSSISSEEVTAAQKRLVYRALNIKDKDSFLAEMANRGLGVFWASSEDKAVTYWGETSPTYVVLEAEVSDEDIDKKTTEELNSHPDYAGEDEVRLLPDRKILVKSATFHKRLSRKEMTDVIFGEAKKPAPEVVQVNKLLNTGSAD